MRKRFVVSKVAAILAMVSVIAFGGVLELDSVRAYLMEPNGVFPQDINLYPPGSKAPAFQLSRVEKVLHQPLLLDSVAADILVRTSPSTAMQLPLAPDSIWALIDVPTGSNPSVSSQDIAQLQPQKLIQTIQKGLRAHTANLNDSEKKVLYQEASGLFLQEEEDTALSPIEGELRRLENEARIHRLMELAGRLQWPGLVEAASAAWQLEVWILRSVQIIGVEATVAKLKRATVGNQDFPIHQGSLGPDRHQADRGIWIDPGGDDEYHLKGVGEPGAFLLIVDLGGNDLYISKDSLSRSAGNMGIELIADLKGNDRYLGANFAFGSTLFGYASLFDLAGHDTYEGRCASLGFGFFGLGIVEDQAGNDVYSASLMSQGVGSTKGIGLLLDRNGNDQYLARPTFKDDLRYTDHNIHMMQGFASGFTPDYAGGIGLLRDGAGNDTYIADIFGQGSAYWYALGLLIDESGDDSFSAYQYAQGAGVHIAVGALLDLGGNDRYASKGVSQGCGHDLGFGLLYDRIGNDTYLATDMSQGAGSANGLGILQDALGNDIYESINLDMTLGHADMRRDRGSFGFFLDGGGMDRYRRSTGDGTAWRVFNGKTKGNGYGLDK